MIYVLLGVFVNVIAWVDLFAQLELYAIIVVMICWFVLLSYDLWIDIGNAWWGMLLLLNILNDM